jgi:hypothetical protein
MLAGEKDAASRPVRMSCLEGPLGWHLKFLQPQDHFEDSGDVAVAVLAVDETHRKPR